MWHVTCMAIWEMRTKISVGNPELKIPPGRPKCRWKNNIKIHLLVGGCEFDSSGSGQGWISGSYEPDNGNTGFINREIFDETNVLKKEFFYTEVVPVVPLLLINCINDKFVFAANEHRNKLNIYIYIYNVFASLLTAYKYQQLSI